MKTALVQTLTVMAKAKTSCGVSGHNISDHFPDVGKMVDLGSGSQRQIEDIILSAQAIGRKGSYDEQFGFV